MKISVKVLFALMGVSINPVAARELTAELIAECGREDNVMIPPAGANETEYRNCINHPLGEAKAAIQGRDLNHLDKRACWHGKAAGCTNNYCWKRCGANLDDGYWCWTAGGDDGKGPWYKCSQSSQCYDYMACGQPANGKACPDCGCDCRDKGS